MSGVDVSRWQGVIDWRKLKNAGVDFAIIKAGGSDLGLYKDSFFEKNYREAKRVGIPIGAYYYVGNRFWTARDGEEDAKRFLKMLSGKSFELPVYLDIEAQNRAYRSHVTIAAQAFCEYMENHGAFVGIYGSEYSTFEEMVYKQDLTKYTWWMANYSWQPKTKCLLWQYTDKGKINGIDGYADMNIPIDKTEFKSVLKVIKERGFNTWT